MSTIRVGVLGVGRFGRLHINVLKQLPGCEVAAIADIDEGALKEASERYAVPKTYADGHEMIRARDLDAVDVVSDEASHGEHVHAALRANKHVFVEKPLATTYEAARESQDMAKTTDRVVMVGNISRFSQPYVRMHRTLASGALGELGIIRTKRDFSKFWFEFFGKRVHAVYESGIHDIDLILWYASGACRQVHAVERHMSGHTYPDIFTATLTFESGLVATMTSAWLVPGGGPRNLVETLELDGTIDADIELIGDKGTARFRMAHPGLTIWTEKEVEHPELTLWPTEHEGVGGAIRAELAHWIARIEKGEQSTVAPLADSVYALRIADAIVESARHGKIVALNGGRE
jgi:predicted dehydrogenase